MTHFTRFESFKELFINHNCFLPLRISAVPFNIVNVVTLVIDKVIFSVTNVPRIVKHLGETEHDTFIGREFDHRLPCKRKTFINVDVDSIVPSVHFFDLLHDRIYLLITSVFISKKLINGNAEIICNSRDHLHIGITSILFPTGNSLI